MQLVMVCRNDFGDRWIDEYKLDNGQTMNGQLSPHIGIADVSKWPLPKTVKVVGGEM